MEDFTYGDRAAMETHIRWRWPDGRSVKRALNRLIRRFIPKGSDIGKYTRAQIQAIEDTINDMPRAVLGGLSANQKKEEIRNEQNT